MTIDELWHKIVEAGEEGFEVTKMRVDDCDDALSALFSHSLLCAKNLHFVYRDGDRFVVAGLRPRMPQGIFYSFFQKPEESNGKQAFKGA